MHKRESTITVYFVNRRKNQKKLKADKVSIMSNNETETETKTNINIKRKIVRTALDIAKESGWANLSMIDISRQGEISLGEIYRHFPGRSNILGEYEKMLGEELLDKFAVGSSRADNPDTHDLLLDIMTERFEIMSRDKKALLSACRYYIFDPITVAEEFPPLAISMRWMLEACGINVTGITGKLKTIALTAIYFSALYEWSKSTESQESDTDNLMAVIDRDLRRGEKLADLINI